MPPKRKTPTTPKKKPTPRGNVLLVTCDRRPPLIIEDATTSVIAARKAYCEQHNIKDQDKAGASIFVRVMTRKTLEEILNGNGKNNP